MRALIHRRLGALASGLLVCAVATVTHAHGPSPATLGLPAGATLNEGVVRLSSGLAVRTDDGASWRYVCPSAWGGPGAPPAVAGSAGVWVIGADGARAWRDGWTQHASPNATTTRAVVSARGEAWALVEDDEGRALVPLDGGPRIALTRAWDAVVATDDGFALADLQDDTLHVAWANIDGAVRASYDVALTRPTAAASLRVVDAQLYVALDQGDLHRLVPLNPPPAAPPTLAEASPPDDASALVWTRASELHALAPLVGPVAWGDTALVHTDGAIVPAATSPDPLWDDQRFTCLTGSTPTHGPVACTPRGLYVLPDTADGDLEARFQLDALTPPARDDAPLERWSTCWAEWLDFSLHAGLDPGVPPPLEEPPDASSPPTTAEPPTSAPTSAPPADGCAVASSPARRAPAPLGVLVAALVLCLGARTRHNARCTILPRSARR